MSQQNIQNCENQNYENQNSIPSDRMLSDKIPSDRMINYLHNQRPRIIISNDNEPIIIPPLNTDIRFNAYNSNSEQQYNNKRGNHNNNKRGN